MHLTTQENLMNGYAGESQAHIRYLYFANIAEREGFKNVARLFRAIAYSEQIHASNHFKLLKDLKDGFLTVAHAPFGPGNTSKNLELAIMGEVYEIGEMYPSYIAVAEMQKENAAKQSFEWALESEKTHATLFKKAKNSVDEGKDIGDEPIYVCEVCGYTVVGDAPDKCPICNAPSNKFKKF